jgi:arsenate reductase
MSEPSACCSPAAQTTCCEPSAKETCCGTQSTANGAPSTCGCAAGETAPSAVSAAEDADDPDSLPVAVIGAGPVGLAAAAHLVARGIEPLVFETGDTVGASIRQWGHVRVFSPWEFNIDPVARKLLDGHAWAPPQADGYPTGDEIVERYLEPLAAVPAIASALRLRSRVVGVTRVGVDKLKDAGRVDAAFELVVDEAGVERRGHFNPVVSLVDAHFGGLTCRDALAYIPAQIAGCISGAVAANGMFALAAISIAETHRASGAHLFVEVIATLGLLLVIFSLARTGRASTAPAAVGAYIGAAYWFTSSTSFANPAISVGRMFSDTFAGIAPAAVPGFVIAQLVGGAVAIAVIRTLYPDVTPAVAADVVLPHDDVVDRRATRAAG